MAVRITLKRSSIPNKRPSAGILDPGELALNTNALTPGLFFETDNNSVVKVGPTAVGPDAPTMTPSLGEMWLDSITKELSVGSFNGEDIDVVWSKIASPYLGGTNGYVVFVAPEFPSSSDDISNNGQASPFRTINRAAIEIAKQSIVLQNESDAGRNNRFTICVSTGICPVYNGPGLPVPADDNPDNIPEFKVKFEGDNPDLPTVLNLQAFNSELGGVILPRGTSLIGMDLRKVELRPTYVPTYQNPTTGEGTNQPRSSIINWTGNSLVSSLSVRDKREVISIRDVKESVSGSGLFVSSRPHCFDYNDRVFFEFASGADQRAISGTSAGILSGYYYVYPVDVDTFYLSYSDLNREPNYVERSQLPVAPQGRGFIATCTWDGRSHNRLATFTSTSKTQLDNFYVKVQLAFPEYFQGRANQAEVINPGETQIVAPVPVSQEESYASNSTDNASPYVENVTIRSNYGLCGLENNGNIVSGFKSALAGQFCVASLQNDPAAYEIYTTIQDPETLKEATGWFPLQYATWATVPSAERPAGPNLVSKAQQLALLNRTDILNIRYYYEDLTASDGKSFGIPNLDRDFRHFSVRATNGAFIQVDTGWTIGCAIGYWSIYGGSLTVTNSSTNFGSNALRAEGYAGWGGTGAGTYADPSDSGFSFAGIRMPEKVLPSDTTKTALYDLGANIISVQNIADELERPTGVQAITLGPGFLPINILPYSLAPGTGIYAKAGAQEYRAFFVDDGKETTVFNGDGTCTLRVRAIDSTFIIGTPKTFPAMANWTSPFIKRWDDPRSIGESSYALILENTQPGHRDPQVGNVLRLNQNASSAAKLLRPNVQLDPGPNGGWGRVFGIGFTETVFSGDSPQYNEVLLNRNYGNAYYVGLIACDYARPWVPELDTAHGQYVTYNNRNWYAAANDDWAEVYYIGEGQESREVKLNPSAFDSPWASTYCLERQIPVGSTYQGQYGADPDIALYENGTYFRGAQPISDNYAFELAVNIDNGTDNFGLLRHVIPTGLKFSNTEVIAPEATTITVNTVEDIPNPLTNFVVMSITSGQSTSSRKEYVQVVGIDKDLLLLYVVRGVYNTKQTEEWEANSVMDLQRKDDKVLPQDYDFDWAPSKAAMIRFLEVMGYQRSEILNLLTPAITSSRPVTVRQIGISPKEGYALSTGPWPLEFNVSSQVDAFSHSFHSVGRLLYSKGLPRYLRAEIPTKQYYDFLYTRIWGGSGSVTGGDELGNLPTGGEFTQIGTGRPLGTYTSNISSFTRIKEDQSQDGGGGGATGVTAIYTGDGLTGGPIYAEGTISLLPPSTDGLVIGGVKAGENITIDEDGVISAGGGSLDDTTVNPPLFYDSDQKILGMNIGDGLTVNLESELALVPGTVNTIGGVKEGVATSISPEGAISVLPPTGAFIGGVKAGSGVTISPDGTISVDNPGPGGSIVLLDNLGPSFNGVNKAFTLTASGVPYAPTNAQSVLVVVGGVVQSGGLTYTIVGATITFVDAPPAGSSFYGLGFDGVLGSLPSAAIIITPLDDISSQFNGSRVQFDLTSSGIAVSPTASYYAFISLGGIVQSTPAAYVVNGSSLQFTEAPAAGTTFYGLSFG